MTPARTRSGCRITVPALALVALLAGCDHGLAPPDEPPTGTLVVDIAYANDPDDWPPPEELYNLLFVAMRFVPQDTSDFFQLNRLVFSERLSYHVSSQTVTLDSIGTGPWPYSGVAQQYGPDLFQWRPVGLVEENDGVFVIARGQTTRVAVTVDFNDLPPFPPE